MSEYTGPARNLADDTMRLPRVSSPTGELSTDTECRCRNSWPRGRRNVWLETDCRCRNSQHHGCRKRLGEERTEVPELRDNNHEAQNVMHQEVLNCHLEHCTLLSLLARDVGGWPGTAI